MLSSVFEQQRMTGFFPTEIATFMNHYQPPIHFEPFFPQEIFYPFKEEQV